MEKLPQPIQILKQFLDRDQNSVNLVKKSSDLVQNFLDSCGYISIDTPIVERTDLFIRKASGDISSQLYTFEDPEGISVSLRPDFTASVIRSLGNSGLLNDEDSIKYIRSFKNLFFTMITINLANIAFALGSIITFMGLKNFLANKFYLYNLILVFCVTNDHSGSSNYSLLKQL